MLNVISNAQYDVVLLLLLFSKISVVCIKVDSAIKSLPFDSIGYPKKFDESHFVVLLRYTVPMVIFVCTCAWCSFVKLPKHHEKRKCIFNGLKRN